MEQENVNFPTFSLWSFDAYMYNYTLRVGNIVSAGNIQFGIDYLRRQPFCYLRIT